MLLLRTGNTGHCRSIAGAACQAAQDAPKQSVAEAHVKAKWRRGAQHACSHRMIRMVCVCVVVVGRGVMCVVALTQRQAASGAFA